MAGHVDVDATDGSRSGEHRARDETAPTSRALAVASPGPARRDADEHSQRTSWCGLRELVALVMCTVGLSTILPGSVVEAQDWHFRGDIAIPEGQTYSIDAADMHDGELVERPYAIRTLRIGEGATLMVRGGRDLNATLVIGQLITKGLAAIRFEPLRTVGPREMEKEVLTGRMWLLDGGRCVSAPLTIDGRSQQNGRRVGGKHGMRLDVSVLLNYAAHELVGRVASGDNVLNHELRIFTNGREGRDGFLMMDAGGSEHGTDGGDGGAVRLRLIPEARDAIESVYGKTESYRMRDILAKDWPSYGGRLGIEIQTTGGMGGEGDRRARGVDGRNGEDGRIVLETREGPDEELMRTLPFSVFRRLAPASWLVGERGVPERSERVASSEYMSVVRDAVSGTCVGPGFGGAPVAVADAVGEGGRGTDRTALEAFYRATGGANWSNSLGWLRTRPVFSAFLGRHVPVEVPLERWYGVVMDGNFQVANGTDRVTWLDLTHNGVSGGIPDALGDLTDLRRLVLPSNELDGRIPAALEKLTNLRELNLSSNRLSGAIPIALGNLTNLTELVLSGNHLSESIPDELGNLSGLTVLSLGSNALNGSIPDSLGTLTNLAELGLSSNALSGRIPASLGQMTDLTTLFLDDNALSGPIPVELGNLAHLTSLSLDDDTGLCLSSGLPGTAFGRLARRVGVPVCGAAATVTFGEATYVVPGGASAEVPVHLSGPVNREVTIKLVTDPVGLAAANYTIEAVAPARIAMDTVRPWLLNLTFPANATRATLVVDVVAGVDGDAGYELHIGTIEEELPADVNEGARPFTVVEVRAERG